jgi:hypothetical protein
LLYYLHICSVFDSQQTPSTNDQATNYLMSEQQGHLRPISMADSQATTMAPSMVEAKEVSETVRPGTTSTAPSARRTSADIPAAAPIEYEKNMGEETVARADQGSASGDDDDDFEYPTAWRLAAITTALCLSVFCMALVRWRQLSNLLPHGKLTNMPGQHHHRNRHSPHHRSVQSSQ